MKKLRRARHLKLLKLPTSALEDRDEMISLLEEELRLVKAGKTIGFAMATIQNDGKTFSIYVARRRWVEMLGAIELLKNDMIRDARDGD